MSFKTVLPKSVYKNYVFIFWFVYGFFYIHVHIVKKVVIFRSQKRKSLPFTINHSSTEKMKSSQYQFPIFFFLSIFSVYNDLETHFLLSTKFRAMFCLHWFNYPSLWSGDNLCPGACYLYWTDEVLRVSKIQTKQLITHSPFYYWMKQATCSTKRLFNRI